MAIHGNFSRLIIDPGKHISSDQLIPLTYADGTLISLNKDGYTLDERLRNYINYHAIVAEVMRFLQPQLVVSIRSHLGEDDAKFCNFDVPDLILKSQTDCYEIESQTVKSLSNFWHQSHETENTSVKVVSVSVDSNFLMFDPSQRQQALAE